MAEANFLNQAESYVRKLHFSTLWQGVMKEKKKSEKRF